MKVSIPLLLFFFLSLIPRPSHAELDFDLITAIASNRIPAVIDVLDQGANVTAVSEDGMTALLIAASRGNPNIIKLLLDHGAQIDKKDNDGWTALMMATSNNKANGIRALLKDDAAIDVFDNEGDNALTIAIKNGHNGAVVALLEYRSKFDLNFANKITGNTPLLLAIREVYPKIAKNLINAGADVNTRSKDGITPLIAATSLGQADIVIMLITHKADTSAKSPDGSSAYDIAKAMEYAKLAEILRMTSSPNLDVVMIAAKENDVDLLRELIKMDIPCDAKTSDGITALKIAEILDNKSFATTIKHAIKAEEAKWK